MASKFDDDVILPDRAYIKDLKNTIITRKDFNDLINNMEQFRVEKRGSNVVEAKDVTLPANPKDEDYGIKLTQYDKRKYEILTRIGNDAVAEHREHILSLPSKTRGKETGQQLAQTRSPYRNDLEHDKKFDFNAMTYRNWESFKATIENRSKSDYIYRKNQLMVDNYIEAIKNVFGDGYPDEAERLIKAVKNNPKAWEIIYEDRQADFTYVYDKKQGLTSRLVNVGMAWGVEFIISE